MFCIHFRIICSSSVKNVMGILIGIAFNLYIALGIVDILAIVILLIHNMRYLPISLYHLQFPSSVSYSLQSIGLSPPWLILFPCILFLCVCVCVILNRIVFLLSLTDSSLLVCRKSRYFHILIMYPSPL